MTVLKKIPQKMNLFCGRIVYTVKGRRYGMNSELEKLAQRYSADLTRLCVSLCGNCADAEDLFQETWLKAARHFHRYRADKPFDKWLFAICVNTYKNTLKAAYHRKRRCFRTAEEQDAFFAAIPDAQGERREEYLALHEAIAVLPKKQRLVIVLCYFKDYSIKDAAQILHIPEGTVKSRMAAAKATLKRRLQND